MVMAKSAFALIGLGFLLLQGVNLAPSLAQSPAVSTPMATPLESQLLGQWRTTDPKSKQSITLVFAPQQQCFMVLPGEGDKTIAIKMRCQLSPTNPSNPQAGELDFVMSASETAFSRYALTPDGKLQVDLDVKPGEKRPATLNPQASVFEKVSESTTLAKDIPVIELEAPTDQSAVPKQYLALLSQAQKDYFITHGKFASSLEELGVVAEMETANYRYEIVPPQDAKRGVLIAAKPKDQQLPTLVGAVFSTDRETMVTGICQSQKADDRLTPKPPTTGTDQIQCPAGSSLVQ